MARRAQRGLASFSDSDEENCTKAFARPLKSGPSKDDVVSLFDTKVFTDKVLNKIREEEEKVTAPGDTDFVLDVSEVGEPPSTIEIIGRPPTKRKTRSSGREDRKKLKLLELLSSDDDEEEELDEFIPPAARTRTASAQKATDDKIIIEIENDEPEESQQVDESLLDCSLGDKAEELLPEDLEDYRVLVKHFGLEESIWIRLKEQDTMQRVYDETHKAVGTRVTLMIDVDGEREELLPTQTVKTLKMSTDRCTIVYSYPLSDHKKAEPNFKLKIITANRRATREIACKPSESFGDIFRRYCEQNDLNRNLFVFKFDGDVLLDTQTPGDHDMQIGEQIEAHGTEQNKASDTDQSKSSRPRRLTRRNC